MELITVDDQGLSIVRASSSELKPSEQRGSQSEEDREEVRDGEE